MNHVTVANWTLNEEQTKTFRSLLWMQLDNMTVVIIPEMIKNGDSALDQSQAYRRFLFQMIEALDGIKMPMYPPSLARIGHFYLTNAHIGAVIVAMRGIIAYCKEQMKVLGTEKEIMSIKLVEDFAKSILTHISPVDIDSIPV